MARTASIERRTGETQVSIDINLDGQGAVRIETGVGFLDHMLHLMARHGCFDLKAVAKGDLHIDSHHTVEDVGLTLGQALKQALGDKAGIRRYGHAIVPMDETLATVAVDLSGRPYLAWQAQIPNVMLGAASAAASGAASAASSVADSRSMSSPSSDARGSSCRPVVSFAARMNVSFFGSGGGARHHRQMPGRYGFRPRAGW